MIYCNYCCFRLFHVNLLSFLSHLNWHYNVIVCMSEIVHCLDSIDQTFERVNLLASFRSQIVENYYISRLVPLEISIRSNNYRSDNYVVIHDVIIIDLIIMSLFMHVILQGN